MRSPLFRAAGATLGTMFTIGGITLGVSNVAMIAIRAGVRHRKVRCQALFATCGHYFPENFSPKEDGRD